MEDPEWEVEILDAAPPADALVALSVGDLDGDGTPEVVISGEDAILWYRPSTYEQGVIDIDATTMVGLELEDIDGDGRDEVVTTVQREADETWQLVWYDSGRTLDDWTRHLVDPACVGAGHDIRYADIDGDGESELITNAAYTTRPGVFAYCRPTDPTDEWERHPITTGPFNEGLAVGDIDGDGRVEIVSGPDLLTPPDEAEVFDREWERETYGPSLRSFCRNDLVDVTGNGLLDIVVSESEYPDSRVCWFENRGADGWRAHELDRGLYDVHSLSAWRDGEDVYVYAAEMAEGGWGGHYRWNAEQYLFKSDDDGEHWSRELLARGTGTHEAAPVELEGSLGFVGKEANHPVVHMVRHTTEPSSVATPSHRLLDRDKPESATDIMATDIDGDGHRDVVTGRWWYRAPAWTRFEIPGVNQVHCAGDIDDDGRIELIGTAAGDEDSPESLTSDLVVLRPVDPIAGDWERHRVGSGDGDWIQGSAVGPIGEDGSLAFVAVYHDSDAAPELFEIPEDVTEEWPSRPLAEVPSGQDLAVADLSDTGHPDVITGRYLLENHGDGTFEPHRILPEGFTPARFDIGDLTGDGRPNLVAGEDRKPFDPTAAQLSRLEGFESEDSRLLGPDPSTAPVPLARLAWFGPSDDPRDEWAMHVVDTVRRPRSVGVGDLDDDGVPEIVVGEHDPSWRYRSQSRLFVYGRVEPNAEVWRRYPIEDRFEHNAGAEVVSLDDDHPAVLSHGWSDSKYVHLWEF